MIKPLVPYAEWSSKYQILPDPVDCPKCLAKLALTIPIAVKGYRGLRAEACKGCGDDSGIARFVPVDRDKVELWEMLRPNSQ